VVYNLVSDQLRTKIFSDMKNKIFILTILGTLLAAACGDEALDKTNIGNQTVETYFKTGDELSRALNGTYAATQNNNLHGREYFFMHDLRSGEFSTGGGQLEAPRAQILTGAQAPSNGVLTPVWNALYFIIHRANAVIAFAPNVPMDEALKARYVAEAKFLRAYAYYQLLGFWGGVPLMKTFATGIDKTQPRATDTEVYQFITSELSSIFNDLPLSYAGNDLGRVTRGAAKVLLAKTHLFFADYASAKTQLEDVKNMGFSLRPNYFDNFTEETEFNQESIWEISFTSNGNYNWDGEGNDYGPNESWIRSQEYSAIGWRNLIPSDALLAEFEANDPRIKDNFYFTGDTYGDPAAPKVLTAAAQQGNLSVFNGVPQKVSWKKYSIMYKLDPGGFYDKIGMNYRVYRYADVLLLLAECENEVGTPAAAIDYLNQVRARASVNMPAYPTTAYPVNSKAEIFRAVMHERMVELAGEEIRNFDIIRWRKNGKTTFAPLAGFKDLMPIPQNEIDNNDKIDQSHQNVGY
jgi:starch-binding outer membrane protein, SusD/RagB family